ncbi:MAG TPA: serine hydrolase, partial [Caulobacteraceae bacterium]|nr:serine hydrolase [Caulobacteraceae bacterium]
MTGQSKALVGGLFLAFAGCAAAYAADPVGDWIGTVTVTPLAYRLAIHIHKTPDGAYGGTYDSLDRATYDVPLAEVAARADSLSFAAPSTNLHYAAKWDAATQSWLGQWTLEGRTYPLKLTHGAFPPAATITGLDGEWDGTLYLGVGLNLRLAFHVATGSHGTLVKFDSVDQGAYGAPASSISRQGDHVRLDMKAIGATLEGDLADGGQTLNTTFTQNTLKAPLTLKRLAPGAPSPWPAPAKAAPAAPPASWTPPSNAEITRLLADRIDVQRQGVGIVIGVIDASGRRIIAYGRRDESDTRALDGDTLFEIGSITKVFSSLVLADMALKGEVKLDDPAARYLPAGVSMPGRNGKAITLVDLDTHTSGLPRMPS